MANRDHLAKFEEGVEVWNQWREEHPSIQPDLQEARLHAANLQKAYLGGANLQKAYLAQANLQEAHLGGANLEGANLEGANLAGAILDGVNLRGANLRQANLQKAYLDEANLEGANLGGANLQKAYLRWANLQEADLRWANLQEANLKGANLQEADLRWANLQKAYLGGANLQKAYLQEAFFDVGTRLRDAVLGDGRSGGAAVADLIWGGANLAVVDWTQVKVLGDEYVAQQLKKPNEKMKTKSVGDVYVAQQPNASSTDLVGNGRKPGDPPGTPAGGIPLHPFPEQLWCFGTKKPNREMKTKSERLADYRTAVRANRQLAVVLRDQGLNEEADHFAYRAQRLQRIVLRRQRKFGRYLFSGFLDLLAGYGYRPGRSIIAYLLIIFGFMGLYLLNAHFVTPHLRWDETLVLSVSSFHGRGFFSQDISLGDTYARLAAAEAVIGLIIEISFIATFTQRFFGK